MKKIEMTQKDINKYIIEKTFKFLNNSNLVLDDDILKYKFGIFEEKIDSITVFTERYNQISILYKTDIYTTRCLIVKYEDNKELLELCKSKYNKLSQQQQEQAEQPQNDYYLRKHDKGKPKLLQVPVEAIQAISEIMDYGSQKYGANSWQQVEIERYLQAGARHLYAIQKDIGAKDEESGIEHLKHALCNLAYAVALYEMKKADNEK